MRESNTALQKAINELEEYLRKYYRSASERVLKEIEAYYGKILTDTPLDAVRTHQLMFGRQYEIYNEISKQLLALGNTTTIEMEKKLIDFYKENYALVGAQNGFYPVAIDDSLVRRIVNAVWVPQDGKTWSQRVWVNLENLQSSMGKILTDAMVTGLSTDKVTEMIMNDMNVGYSQACRLARTELAHVRVQSTIDRYIEAGVTKYEYIANGPNMCEECEELNGQIFDIEDIEHLPPVHPNCVCAILAVLDSKKETS